MKKRLFKFLINIREDLLNILLNFCKANWKLLIRIENLKKKYKKKYSIISAKIPMLKLIMSVFQLYMHIEVVKF